MIRLPPLGVLEVLQHADFVLVRQVVDFTQLEDGVGLDILRFHEDAAPREVGNGVNQEVVLRAKVLGHGLLFGVAELDLAALWVDPYVRRLGQHKERNLLRQHLRVLEHGLGLAAALPLVVLFVGDPQEEIEQASKGLGQKHIPPHLIP